MKKIFDSQIEEFPIVLIPPQIYNNIFAGVSKERIEEILKAYEPRLKGTRPYPPSKFKYVSYSKVKLENYEQFLAIMIAELFIVFRFDTLDTISLKLLAFLGIALFVFISMLMSSKLRFKSYNYSEKVLLNDFEYSREFDKFERNLAIYEADNFDYELRLNEFLKGKLSLYSKIEYEIYLEEIKPFRSSTRDVSDHLRGASEFFFLRELVKYFGDKIKMDLIPDSSKYLPFKPDFTFVCPHSQLHIDIEIDEPYSFKEKIPIHHQNSGDSTRNDFFMSINWIVIRFSEKQIVENPSGCIKTIDSVYQSVLSKRTDYEVFTENHQVWTYEESLLLSQLNFRNQYINKIKL